VVAYEHATVMETIDRRLHDRERNAIPSMPRRSCGVIDSAAATPG
jgi:hypothetical protein